jgi:hypothetical protein
LLSMMVRHHTILYFVGLTVSASIPAAIISMSLLRSIYGKDVGKAIHLACMQMQSDMNDGLS